MEKKKKKLIWRVSILSVISIIIFGAFVYLHYHPTIFFGNGVNRVVISTYNEELNLMDHKEVVIENPDEIKELLKPIQGKLFYDVYSPTCMCDYSWRFGEYEVKVGDKYIFILTSPSSSRDVHEGKFRIKDKYGILAEFPNEFLEKIVEYMES